MAVAQLAILLEHHGGVSGATRGGSGGGLTQEQQQHPLVSLRLVSCGGSSVTLELVRALWAAAPRATYFTDYGMTEAGGRVCSTLVLPSEDEALAALVAHVPAFFSELFSRSDHDRARLLAGASLHSSYIFSLTLFVLFCYPGTTLHIKCAQVELKKGASVYKDPGCCLAPGEPCRASRSSSCAAATPTNQQRAPLPPSPPPRRRLCPCVRMGLKAGRC